MLILRFVVWMLATGLITSNAVAASSHYPNKPIRLVSPESGGSGDFAARLIAPGLAAQLGQPVIVDNRAAQVAIETVAKVPPDGYTLLFIGPVLWMLPLLRAKVSYDPIKDFSPITLTTTSPNVLVVHPSLAASSVKELIELAKAKPGILNYASGEAGSSSHLSGELFKAMAGVNIVRVAFKGNAPALIALIGGDLQLGFPPTTSASQHIKSGKLRGLAVTGTQPSALVPGLPTVAASGLPGYESVGMNAMLAPAHTPAALINRLNQEVVRILSQPEVKQKFLSIGVETVGDTPQQLAAALKGELVKWGKIIKNAGIREE